MYIAYYHGPRVDVKVVARQFGYGIWNGMTLWFQNGQEFQVNPEDVVCSVREKTPVPILASEIILVSNGLVPTKLLEFTKHPNFPKECYDEEWCQTNGKHLWCKADLFRAYMYWCVVKLMLEQGKEIDTADLWNRLRS